MEGLHGLTCFSEICMCRVTHTCKGLKMKSLGHKATGSTCVNVLSAITMFDQVGFELLSLTNPAVVARPTDGITKTSLDTHLLLIAHNAAKMGRNLIVCLRVLKIQPNNNHQEI